MSETSKQAKERRMEPCRLFIVEYLGDPRDYYGKNSAAVQHGFLAGAEYEATHNSERAEELETWALSNDVLLINQGTEWMAVHGVGPGKKKITQGLGKTTQQALGNLHAYLTGAHEENETP